MDSYTMYKGVTPESAFADLNGFIKNIFNQTNVHTGMNDVMRSFLVMEDLGRLVHHTNAILIGLVIPKLHYMQTKILPLKITDEIEFRTEILVQDSSLPQQVPHLGVARLTQTKRMALVSKAHKYGVGAFMESSFKNTPEGRKAFIGHIVHFARTTCRNLACVSFQTLLVGRNLDEEAPTPLFRDKASYIRAKAEEVSSFAVANKYAVGVNRMVVEGVTKMLALPDAVMPTAIILPSGKLTQIMISGSEQRYNASSGGEQGVTSLNRDLGVTNINGVEVYEAPSLDQHYLDSAPSAQRITGQYFHCKEHPGQDATLPDYGWGVYDVNVDNYQDIRFTTLALASGAFVNAPVGGRLELTDPLGLAMWAEMHVGVPYDDKVNRGDWEFICFRPMEAYRTNMAILVAGGNELGFTSQSPELLEIGNDAGNHTWQLQSRGYVGAHVMNWDRVHRIDNAFYAGIVGGGGAGILSHDAAKKVQDANFVLQEPTGKCMFVTAFTKTRLAADGSQVKNFPTRPHFLHLAKSHFANDDHADLVGGPNDRDNRNGVFGDKKHTNENSDYPWQMHYSNLYGFDRIKTCTIQQETASVTDICFQGGLRYLVNNVYMYIEGRSHHGPYEGVGCAQVRDKGISQNPQTLK